jgi:hypothetical protein
MPADELNKWAQYLTARPIGWREDNRTSMLLSVQGVKQSGSDLFPTLAALQKWEDEKPEEQAMRSSLKKSVFGALLEQANAKK